MMQAQIQTQSTNNVTSAFGAIPSFEHPVEVRFGLQMGGRALKLKRSRYLPEKLRVARDLKTFIDSCSATLGKSHELSNDFQEYVDGLQEEVNKVFAQRVVI